MATRKSRPTTTSKSPTTSDRAARIDRAARRYCQIHGLEREMEITEASIKEALQHVTDAKNVVKELREKRASLLVDLLKAARNEGDLPLLDLAELDA